jgi:hypothetical protein
MAEDGVKRVQPEAEALRAAVAELEAAAEVHRLFGRTSPKAREDALHLSDQLLRVAAWLREL